MAKPKTYVLRGYIINKKRMENGYGPERWGRIDGYILSLCSSSMQANQIKCGQWKIPNAFKTVAARGATGAEKRKAG
ncbi:MAG: hypothetical protein LBT16_07905 [Treponema sp.]|nr:hypothetical protein [Treponema sp.]